MTQPIVKPRKRKKPIGTVSPLTQEEIRRLATITVADVEQIKQELVPELRDLLDAEPMKPK